MPSNDLFEFMLSATNEIASEYERIRKRALEDPGMAGDQGEENWASILRQWLPPAYQIVTRGRILGLDGQTSPQVDVLVLNPSYPRFLLNKKVYLAGGVAAVFECKVTLKSEHIDRAFVTAGKILSLVPPRVGTPVKELNSPIIFGVLAHSCAIRGDKTQIPWKIMTKLRDADKRIVEHPRNSVDLVCVADLATWCTSKITYGAQLNHDVYGTAQRQQTDVSATTTIIQRAPDYLQHKGFTPIGSMLAYLVERLAWEDVNLRPWAEYFREVLKAYGQGLGRPWDATVFSEQTRSLLAARAISDGPRWDEWNHWFP